MSFGRAAGPPAVLSLIAALALVVGTALALTSGRDILNAVDDLERTPFPGVGPVTLEAGSPVVYYEPGEDGGEPSEQAFAAAVSISPPNGPPLAERPYSGDADYSLPGRDSGVALMRVDVPADGDYLVVADAASGIPAGEVAIGPEVFGESMGRLLTLIGGAILAVAGLVGLLVLLGMRRSAARRGVREREALLGRGGEPPVQPDPPSEPPAPPSKF
jgi:hypothetical protein